MSTITDGFTPAPSSTPDVPDPQAAVPDALAVANLDKVRDILFGAQMRDYDRRFSRLEERLVRETTALNDEVRRRLAALEDFVKRETETLSDRIRSENESRTDATTALSRELQEVSGALNRKTGALDDQLGKVQREARQQLLDQYQRLSDEMREKADDLLSRIHKESTDLRSDKADRATIATLLTEMALRLKNELSVPGLDSSGNR